MRSLITLTNALLLGALITAATAITYAAAQALNRRDLRNQHLLTRLTDDELTNVIPIHRHREPARPIGEVISIRADSPRGECRTWINNAQCRRIYGHDGHHVTDWPA